MEGEKVWGPEGWWLGVPPGNTPIMAPTLTPERSGQLWERGEEPIPYCLGWATSAKTTQPERLGTPVAGLGSVPYSRRDSQPVPAERGLPGCGPDRPDGTLSLAGYRATAAAALPAAAGAAAPAPPGAGPGGAGRAGAGGRGAGGGAACSALTGGIPRRGGGGRGRRRRRKSSGSGSPSRSRSRSKMSRAS